jgi:hypothetical protein
MARLTAQLIFGRAGIPALGRAGGLASPSTSCTLAKRNTLHAPRAEEIANLRIFCSSSRPHQPKVGLWSTPRYVLQVELRLQSGVLLK